MYRSTTAHHYSLVFSFVTFAACVSSDDTQHGTDAATTPDSGHDGADGVDFDLRSPLDCTLDATADEYECGQVGCVEVFGYRVQDHQGIECADLTGERHSLGCASLQGGENLACYADPESGEQYFTLNEYDSLLALGWERCGSTAEVCQTMAHQ